MPILRRSVLAVALAIVPVPHAVFAQSSPVKLEAAAPKPVNLDFEEGEPGKAPVGWIATTAAAGYPAETIAERPKSGKQCVVLRAESATGQFGIVMQSVDATAYRGHRIRLRAALRAADGAGARMWMRVDRSGMRMGFFDNMQGRPVTSADWQDVEFVCDVDDDAESLNFGLLLLGGGRIFADAIALDDVGKLTVVAEPARPFAGRGLENVEAFARVLGYVRHFHPSDEAAATDWDAFAVDGIRKVETAASPAGLARELEAIFRPVAPTLRVAPSGTKPTPSNAVDILKGAATVVEWRHHGFGNKPGSGQEQTYSSERVRAALVDHKLPDGFHDPAKPLVVDLPGGVTCWVPLALVADATGTLPRAPARPPAESGLIKYTGNDRATRLADVALAWNVFEHFYPYFDVAKTDWRAELGRALTAAAADTSDEAFTLTLRRMVWALHDGHGGVQGPAPSQATALPILWAWVENRLVVTSVAPEGGAGLARGDVVERIDGRPSLAAIEERERLTSSATPQWARYRVLRELRSGPPDSSVALEVRTASGETRTVTLARTAAGARLEEPRPEKIAEVKPGVFYVDVGRISDADFDAALPKLVEARGVVFDLRGYPSGLSPMPLQHLTDRPLESARWNVPVIADPDWTGTPGWDGNGRWTLEPVAPRLKGKIVFVTDGRAISYAETWMGIVEAYKLAEIVGETTAGTNGNINPFSLPGGYTIYWTGMKVLKHDGSRHHGVGIAPTVPVSRTLRGVAEGRDEQLDRAVAIAGGRS